MKAAEFRKFSTEDLSKKIVDLKKELYHLRFQQAVGQLENTGQIRVIRKNIARINTIVTERGE